MQSQSLDQFSMRLNIRNNIIAVRFFIPPISRHDIHIFGINEKLIPTRQRSNSRAVFDCKMKLRLALTAFTGVGIMRDLVLCAEGDAATSLTSAPILKMPLVILFALFENFIVSVSFPD